MYCDICSEPLSSTANGGRCNSCRNLSDEFTDQILKLKVKWRKLILEDYEKSSFVTQKMKAELHQIKEAAVKAGIGHCSRNKKEFVIGTFTAEVK